MQAVDTRKLGKRPAHPFALFARQQAEARGMELNVVERMAGVAQSCIGHWSNLGIRPRIDNIEAVLAVLGFKLQIVPLKDPPEPSEGGLD